MFCREAVGAAGTTCICLECFGLQTSGSLLFVLSPDRSLLTHDCYLTTAKYFVVISNGLALGKLWDNSENNLEVLVPKLGEHSLWSQQIEMVKHGNISPVSASSHFGETKRNAEDGKITSCQLNLFDLARTRLLLEHWEDLWQP